MAVKNLSSVTLAKMMAQRERDNLELERQRQVYESRISDLQHVIQGERVELAVERARCKDLTSKLLENPERPPSRAAADLLPEILDAQRRILAALHEANAKESSSEIAHELVRCLKKDNVFGQRGRRVRLRRRSLSRHRGSDSDEDDDDESESEDYKDVVSPRSHENVRKSEEAPSVVQQCRLGEVLVIVLAWVFMVLFFHGVQPIILNNRPDGGTLYHSSFDETGSEL